ncbi:hypothetical protein [Acinetobacter lactucae]|uniref:hypothetical protein n=1 Tax=Acinetobacter lactucae TaxID=1785128 RepID=UPI0007072234|nr:hypothetical protein [Acinetobacter lactucae]KQE85283.1 hypothetical protein APB94_17460 [Acinetobacter lactucae]
MFTFKNLPDNYLPLEKLTICSNKIVGGGFPFSLGEGLPIIIGGGNNPNVWIQALTNSHVKNLTLIVDENISKAKEISVVKPTNGVIEVYYKSTIKILRVKSNGERSATISHLDLRPIGLNITGTPLKLNIGGSSFSNNTVKGTNVFVGLG